MPPAPIDYELVRDFAIALLIGALVGIEREKKKTSEGDIGIGGIRTFILFSQAGAISAWLSLRMHSPWIFAVTVGGVAAAVIAGYLMQARTKPQSLGLTTEMAAIVVCLLGGAVMIGHTGTAVGLAVITSATLAYKQPLHVFIGRFHTDDIYAGLKLMIATFIVLPLLPDEPVDAWGVLNPYRAWWLVILISGLSLVGYVLVRWLGTERGTVLTGVTGGLVSSTAVTLTFARRSREQAQAPIAADALASGILLSWAVMFGRILVEVAVVFRDLLQVLFVPLAILCAVATLLGGLFYWRSRQGSAGEPPPTAGAPYPVELANPFSLYAASKFACLFIAVQFIVAAAQRYAPGNSLYAVAMLAGLTEVDAITLSMADFAKQGGSYQIAAVSIALAALANTLVKTALLALLASRVLAARVALATLLILATAAVVIWLAFGRSG